MNEKIQLLDYTGRITYILSRLALPPFHPEDQLLVNIEFEEPYPASIMSTTVAIPVKDYGREELLEVVKKYGEEQLAAIIEKHNKEQEEAKAREQRKEELQALAKRIELKF